jgi:single-stranded DNA-binding protein
MATNTVTLEGNIVAEPKIIPLKDSSGIAARFRLAVNREGGRVADFIDCVAFGDEAVIINDRTLKGTHIKIINRGRALDTDTPNDTPVTEQDDPVAA